MKTAFISAAIALLLTGCYTAKYLPFAGQQQEWPTATGSFITTNAGLPVFYGYPPKPYVYIGQIRISSQSPVVDVVEVAAKQAKDKKADALLIIDESERPIGSVGSGSGFGFSNGRNQAVGTGFGSSAVQYGGVIRAIAIKWKP